MAIASAIARGLATRNCLCSMLAAAIVAGCGPLTSVMPARLDADQQFPIDGAWNTALSPVSRADHRALLDILVTTYAWELGAEFQELEAHREAGGPLPSDSRRLSELAARRQFVTTAFPVDLTPTGRGLESVGDRRLVPVAVVIRSACRHAAQATICAQELAQ